MYLGLMKVLVSNGLFSIPAPYIKMPSYYYFIDDSEQEEPKSKCKVWLFTVETLV